MTTVTLCGYELTADLDFDLDNDGSTITNAGLTGTDHAGNRNGGTLDSEDVTAYFTIDANGRGGWTPIGPGTGADDAAVLANSFTAIFEGNNNTISNLSIIAFEVERVGLFGRVGPGGHIRNLGLIDATVNGIFNRGSNTPSLRTGTLIAEAVHGTITGCYATGGSVFANGGNGITILALSLDEAAGGLIGISFGSTIIASHADVDIIGGEFGDKGYGGLVGIASSGTQNGVSRGTVIIASYADGDIITHDNNPEASQIGGGLVGFMNTAVPNRIIASYATGNITTGTHATGIKTFALGGLTGQARGGAISASYATGNIVSNASASTSSNYLGGLVGISGRTGTTLTANYAAVNLTAPATGPGTNDTAQVTSALGYSAPHTRATYGFGTITGPAATLIIPAPTGVTAATGLTAANVSSCDDRAFTTQATCESPDLTLTPGTWTSTDRTCAAPATGATDGVDYTAFTSSSTCTATSKRSADVWTTWSNASENTLNAWVFETGVAPKLRYADYDGAGTVVDCDMFPAIIPGTTTPLVCGPSGSELGGQ